MTLRWTEDAQGNFVSGDRAAYEWSKKSAGSKFLTWLIVAGVWTAIVLIGMAIKGNL
jgi:hypothetical protein